MATKPITRTILISPDMASRMLEKNNRNRTMSAAVVDRYRRDMEAGRWLFAGDPIRFDDAGTLIDGQHRLLAVVRAGVTLPFLVIEGLNPESQMVMDQGKRRSTAQQLSIKGVPNPVVVAAGVKLHMVRVTGYLFRDNKEAAAVVSTAAIERWVIDNERIVTELAPHTGLIRRCCDAPPSVSYAAAIAFLEIDPAACLEFFRLLDVGAGEGNPVNALDKRLQRDRRQKIKVSQRDQLGMFFQVWNLWREDRQVTRIQRPGGSYTAETFPKLVTA